MPASIRKDGFAFDQAKAVDAVLTIAHSQAAKDFLNNSTGVTTNAQWASLVDEVFSPQSHPENKFLRVFFKGIGGWE
jgi:hypothetical protein